MGIQRKYLVQAGNWGGPCNLVVTELSDFRLKALWGLCRHNKSVVVFSSSMPVIAYITSSLLCRKAASRNIVKISVQLFCFPCPGKMDDGWSLPGSWMHSRVLQFLPFPVSGPWLPVLKDSYSMEQWCHFGSVCWERAVKGPCEDLQPLPCKFYSGFSPCSWLLLKRYLSLMHVCA